MTSLRSGRFAARVGRRTTALALGVALAASACSQEATTPLEFGTPGGSSSTIPSGTAPPSAEDDPNAEARAQIQQLAEAECAKDDRAEGVIQMADAETGEVVSEYRIDCVTLEPITGARPEGQSTQG